MSAGGVALGIAQHAGQLVDAVLAVHRAHVAGGDASAGSLRDHQVMVGPGGQERTRSEFADLFARAGLRLKRVYPTASPVSILEATR